MTTDIRKTNESRIAIFRKQIGRRKLTPAQLRAVRKGEKRDIRDQRKKDEK